MITTEKALLIRLRLTLNVIVTDDPYSSSPWMIVSILNPWIAPSA